MELYPLKFQPILKQKIWGGSRLKEILNKDVASLHNVGESWEISSVPGELSVVLNGALSGLNIQEAITEFKEKLVGKSVYKTFGNSFPLLVKFIDANDYLSIQVHPDDKLAQKRHNSFGKTEMWYIIEAEKNAELIVGFNQAIDTKSYLHHMEKGSLQSVLNFEKVQADDVFFLPAGRIHATGAGILFAEIQQTSDITYRIYDWDRKDEQGNQRELHTELAADAIDFTMVESYKTQYVPKKNQSNELVSCNYFKSNQLLITEEMSKDYSNLDSFVILMALDGDVELHFNQSVETILKGETVLVPASITNVKLLPLSEKVKLMEVYIT